MGNPEKGSTSRGAVESYGEKKPPERNIKESTARRLGSTAIKGSKK